MALRAGGVRSAAAGAVAQDLLHPLVLALVGWGRIGRGELPGRLGFAPAERDASDDRPGTRWLLRVSEFKQHPTFIAAGEAS